MCLRPNQPNKLSDMKVKRLFLKPLMGILRCQIPQIITLSLPASVGYSGQIVPLTKVSGFQIRRNGSSQLDSPFLERLTFVMLTEFCYIAVLYCNQAFELSCISWRRFAISNESLFRQRSCTFVAGGYINTVQYLLDCLN